MACIPLMVDIGSSRMDSFGIGGAMLCWDPLMVGIGMNRMESLDIGVGAMLCCTGWLKLGRYVGPLCFALACFGLEVELEL